MSNFSLLGPIKGREDECWERDCRFGRGRCCRFVEPSIVGSCFVHLVRKSEASTRVGSLCAPDQKLTSVCEGGARSSVSNPMLLVFFFALYKLVEYLVLLNPGTFSRCWFNI